MTANERIRHQRLLRQAEGYLELTHSGPSAFALDKPLRKKLAAKCLERLEYCRPTLTEKSHWLYLRGEALRTLERFDEAIKPLREASVLDEENVHIYLAIAWCQKRTGNLELAIDALERALEFDYSLPILHYNLACYWALRNEPKLVVSFLATAFEIDQSFRRLVEQERDFDQVRKHPDFLALTAVNV